MYQPELAEKEVTLATPDDAAKAALREFLQLKT
jgi:hypothetical protein